MFIEISWYYNILIYSASKMFIIRSTSRTSSVKLMRYLQVRGTLILQVMRLRVVWINNWVPIHSWLRHRLKPTRPSTARRSRVVDYFFASDTWSVLFVSYGTSRCWPRSSLSSATPGASCPSTGRLPRWFSSWNNNKHRLRECNIIMRTHR